MIASTGEAIILVVLTVDPIETRNTLAQVTIDPVHTGAFILARGRHTFIYLNIAKGTSEAILAFTDKCIISINTDCIIGTWLLGTVVKVDFTIFTYNG